MDAASAAAAHLISDVLDDPTVTQQDLEELKEMWDRICRLSGQKQERLDAALEVSTCVSWGREGGERRGGKNGGRREG